MDYNSIESQVNISNIKRDKFLSITICAFLSFNQIVYFINILFNFFLSDFVYDTMLCYIILIALLMMSIFKIRNKIKIDIIYLLLTLLFLFLSSYLFNYENRRFMFTSIFDYKYNPFYNLFIFAFPLYLLVRQIDNYNILEKTIYKFSVFVLIISNIMFIFDFIGLNIEIQYMVFSYNMVFFVCYLIYDFIMNRRKSALLLAGVSFIVIFIAGARGPLVCIFSYIILFVIFNVKTNYRKVLPIIVVLIISFVIIIANFNNIIYKLNTILINNNYNSRTISMILDNNITFDSYRSEIVNKVMNDFYTKYLIGNGMFGDRAVTEGIFGDNQGVYAHNIIIEFLSQYGIILGALFLIIIFSLLTIGIFKCKDSVLKNLLLVSISCGLVKLFLSGSYLNEPYFFLMLGISVSIIKNEAATTSIIKEGDII